MFPYEFVIDKWLFVEESYLGLEQLKLIGSKGSMLTGDKVSLLMQLHSHSTTSDRNVGVNHFLNYS